MTDGRSRKFVLILLIVFERKKLSQKGNHDFLGIIKTCPQKSSFDVDKNQFQIG